ncbi:MAG TPA: NUDIX domain-containing protein [Kineosporiaceae bacterium]
MTSPRPAAGLRAGANPPAAADAPGTDPRTPATGPGGRPVPPAPAGPPDVVAAGVICWRPARDGRLEVLMVHRAGPDEWGWPSGVPERRESLAECAVRQATEKAGTDVVLGRPLTPVRCLPEDGGREDVTYWAARPGRPGPPAKATSQAVDDVRWVPFEAAADQLARTADNAPLQSLAGYAGDGTLATTATLVVRHATARPRDAWARADADRPLVASGKRQALALGALLQCWRPEQVISSPWRRCLDTMAPYLALSGARLRTKSGLSEAGHRRSPAKATRHLRQLLESPRGGALCTHRPVLGDVLAAVRDWCTPEAAPLVPRTNPYLHPGDVLVAHATRRPGSHPLVVAVERHGTR